MGRSRPARPRRRRRTATPSLTASQVFTHGADGRAARVDGAASPGHRSCITVERPIDADPRAAARDDSRAHRHRDCCSRCSARRSHGCMSRQLVAAARSISPTPPRPWRIGAVHEARRDARHRDEIGRLGARIQSHGRAGPRRRRMRRRARSQSAHAVGRRRRIFSPRRAAFSPARSPMRRCSPELARHCIPTIADYCTIHIADDDGAHSPRRNGASTIRAKPAPSVALVARYEYRVDGPGEVPQVIRTQQPLVVPRARSPKRSRARPMRKRRKLLDRVGPIVVHLRAARRARPRVRRDVVHDDGLGPHFHARRSRARDGAGASHRGRDRQRADLSVARSRCVSKPKRRATRSRTSWRR